MAKRMKRLVPFLLSVILCACSWSIFPQPLEDVTQVTYTEATGTVSPEFQWRERYIISLEGSSFTRTGPVAAEDLNTGNWEIEVEDAAIEALFGQLEAVDRSSIRAVTPRPGGAPVGGGSQNYAIVYAGDRKLSLGYGNGTIYRNGEVVTGPIDAFIAELSLPSGAVRRYK